MTSVIALHALLFMVVFASGRALPLPAQQPGALALVSLNVAASAKSLPPPPSLPSKFADRTQPVSQPTVANDPNSTALAAPAGSCATLNVVMTALVSDPAAVTAVINAPPETRSIAEAVVIWNVGWSNAASSLDAPLAPARTVVEQSLLTVADACLDEQVAGPRLMPVPDDAGGTMFLVIGSGNWTWRELVTDPATGEMVETLANQPKSIFDWDWF